MIKLVATDMDGTFLDENGTYDKKRLANVLKKFKEQGIVFTAASGRSLLSLEQLFADFRDQMAFIAENGSAAVLFDRLAYEQHLSREQYLDIIDHLSKSPYMENNEYVLSGKDGAYILSDANPGYIEFIAHYYDNLQKVSHFEDVDDIIFKVTANFTEETVRQAEEWVNQVIPYATAVTTGFKSIDIILSSVNKRNGLEHLCEQYGIRAEEVLSFGDNINDLEMLEWSGKAIATENARPEVKEIADCIIGHHNDQAVMAYLESMVD